MSKWVIMLLVAAPALGLVGWFVYEQYPVWSRPRWGAVNPGACAATASLEIYNAGWQPFAQPTITRDAGRAIAGDLITQQYGLPARQLSADESLLVAATFPDSGERLAWVYLGLLGEGDESTPGKAAVVYIDADSGEPLTLITAGAAADPRTACEMAALSRRALVRTYLPLVIAAGYAFKVGIIVSLLALRRRIKQRAAINMP